MAPISQSLSQVASQRVNRVLAPQLQQQTSYGQHQNAVIRAFANSLLGQLQPIAGQVGGDYDAAIKQIGGLSANAAQYLDAQNPVAQQQALQSSVNAPASQQAQAAQGLSDTFRGGAGVLAFTQGVVPGGELAGNKAAAMAQARQLPGIAALAGQQSLSSALLQQGQDRAKLEGQRPGLVQDEEAAIQKTNLANAQIRQRAAAAQATAHWREAQLKETTRQHEATTKLGYAKVKQSAADKAADRAATKTFHDSYLQHLRRGDNEQASHDAANEDAANTRNAISQQQANTSEFSAQTSRIQAKTSARSQAASQKNAAARLKVSQRREAAYEKAQAAKTAKAKATKRGISPTSYANLRKQALAKADTFYYGKEPKADGTGGVPGIDYGVAMKQLVNGYSLSPADARAILNDFYAPGERGRPTKTQEGALSGRVTWGLPRG